jgi:hypothetical protein
MHFSKINAQLYFPHKDFTTEQWIRPKAVPPLIGDFYEERPEEPGVYSGC